MAPQRQSSVCQTLGVQAPWVMKMRMGSVNVQAFLVNQQREMVPPYEGPKETRASAPTPKGRELGCAFPCVGTGRV